MDMHPDSRLRDSLDYLVPAEPRPVASRLAKEITFLDPSCGSMHFGLVAFDLYAEMYREELDRAGEQGWPAKPSVASADEIPASIIANNLHGIDLDLRAVQLSALTLFLRARTLNPACAFSDRNLACANIEAITQGRLESLAKEAELGHPVYGRVLRRLTERLKDSDSLGSLLRPERDLEALVAEERRRAHAARDGGPDLEGWPEWATEGFAGDHGMESFFDRLTDEILNRLDESVRRSRKLGRDPGHFVGEASKGLRFARLVSHRYDVVATNPPYLNSRNMSAPMRNYLGAEMDAAKEDLYAAFILRAAELLAPDGMVMGAEICTPTRRTP